MKLNTKLNENINNNISKNHLIEVNKWTRELINQ